MGEVESDIKGICKLDCMSTRDDVRVKGTNHEMEQDTVNGTGIRTTRARSGDRKRKQETNIFKQMTVEFIPL